MNTCPICNRHSNPIPFTLGALARDEKLPFVERVLSLVIESRHGSHRRAIPLPKYSEPPVAETKADLDLVTHAFIPGMMCDASNKTKLGNDKHERLFSDAATNGKEYGDATFSKTRNHSPPARSPSTLGRGSP